MRFLFIVQGEGRGHLTQAISLRNILTKHGHEVVEVLVGKSTRRSLPAFFYEKIKAPVHRFVSPNFLPTPKNKKADLRKTAAYNLLASPAYLKSILSIRKRIKRLDADMVINFYDLLTGLSYALFPPKVPCVCIGHQYLLLSPDYPFPKENKAQIRMLKFYTRTTAIRSKKQFALSFAEAGQHHTKKRIIMPPLLRDEVLNATISDGDYIHGYMLNEGFAEEVMDFHKEHPEENMHFFWDKKGVKETETVDESLSFHRLNDELFIQYMAGCRAYATTAGFESVCEAMYLGKPALMVPSHIEQACNGYEAQMVGAGITADSFDLEVLLNYAETYQPNPAFRAWVDQAEKLWISNLESIQNDRPTKEKPAPNVEHTA